VATTKRPIFNLPKIGAGLLSLAPFFLSLIISACQTSTPSEITLSYWQALAQGQLENAKKLATLETAEAVNLQDIQLHSTIKIGQSLIDDDFANVNTTIIRNNREVTFNTALQIEDGDWKVDVHKTRLNITMIPLDGVVKSLQQLGDTFAKNLEEQLPIIQKEMESLGIDLQKQIEDFGRAIEKQNPQPPNKIATPPPGTI
jgi:hypothetical protein